MYYRLKYGKNYLIKIIILVLAAVLGEIFILWGMTRQENIDWISSQIIHTPWPYAISEMDNGKIIVGNIIQGFEITLPAGWQVSELKHPNFYFQHGDEIICEIKSDIINYRENIGAVQLLEENIGFVKTYVAGFLSIKKESIDESKNFIYELKIPIKKDVIFYILSSNEDNKYECSQYFEQIKRSFLYYE